MFAGEVHYFRLAPERWGACLRALVELGFAAVDIPVPWSLHAPTRGAPSWDDQLDLRRFVELAAEIGLEVIIRPGPHLGRELPGIGFPSWVTEDPSMRAHTVRDTPALWPFPPRMVPLPDYGAEPFRAATEEWYGQIATALAGHGLAGVALDHELNHFGRVDLTTPADAQASLAESASWLRSAWRGAGLEALQTWLALPVASAAIETLLGGDAVAATSCYGDPRTLPGLAAAIGENLVDRERRELVGVTAGGSPFAVHRPPTSDLSHLAAAIAAGARQVSVGIPVERERWYGAWITEDGSITPHGQQMGRTLRALSTACFADLTPDAALAVVATDGPRRPAECLPGLPPILAELFARAGGFDVSELKTALDRERVQWDRVVAEALRLAQIPHRRIHPRAPVRGERALIFPTLGPASEEARQCMSSWAETVPVVAGPTDPTPANQTLSGMGLVRRESLSDVDALADDLLGVAGELPDDGIAPERRDIECTSLRDGDGVLRVLVVANHGGDTEIELALDGPLHDPAAGIRLQPNRNGMARVSAKRTQVRLFVSEE